MRRIAEGSLNAGDFEKFLTDMVRSMAKRKTLTPEQTEAYVLAFFDVLMNKMLDARNRMLAELRRV